MGKLCTAAYAPNPVTSFLTPKAHIYREDNIRQHRQGCRRRFLNPRNLSIVACLASDPSTPVGHGQFSRLGDDEGAKQFVRDRGLRERLWIFTMSWIFHFYHTVENIICPDRITDNARMKEFESWVAEDQRVYWTSHPERSSRWNAQNIIVCPKFQGKGIGKKIMLEGLKRAQNEWVIMGLTASIEGEHLYRKLGFELLGPFTHRVPRDDREGGGIMIWNPENPMIWRKV
jgi:GNAT superfamily N-acetyltransferase